MWLFTTKGFISAVEWIGEANYLCVRARAERHLAALFPDAEIVEMRDADYRFRAKIDRAAFEQAVLRELRAIDYPDFKSQLRDNAYHDACLSVWHSMHTLQSD